MDGSHRSRVCHPRLSIEWPGFECRRGRDFFFKIVDSYLSSFFKKTLVPTYFLLYSILNLIAQVSLFFLPFYVIHFHFFPLLKCILNEYLYYLLVVAHLQYLHTLLFLLLLFLLLFFLFFCASTLNVSLSTYLYKIMFCYLYIKNKLSTKKRTYYLCIENVKKLSIFKNLLILCCEAVAFCPLPFRSPFNFSMNLMSWAHGSFLRGVLLPSRQARTNILIFLN